jgi:site-specific DNA-methyltransferase (adenine-specific)
MLYNPHAGGLPFLNVAQRRDALELLCSLPVGCAATVFFDPQHRSNLNKLKYGNEGARQKERVALPAMSDSYIDDACCEIARTLKPSGYLMLWADAFPFYHLRLNDGLKRVELISWDDERVPGGNGYRARRRGGYLIGLQKKPIRARATWRDHKIPDHWSEKVDRKIHPLGLITRLIGAVTEPGDLIVDPCAGSFVVMHAAHRLERNFIGGDIAFGGDRHDS